ncbi:Asp23/Gls24 family envelope stress response protein [Sciscionella marina]|uniref:Asp23/Gls24 family envelope stress response protein n=1 Tax=Sciscionella marina TaxID=508770 RepID=UPI0003603252|nr:Asp23/Gls24 family envelope stress response protein [Sciscionella marina]
MSSAGAEWVFDEAVLAAIAVDAARRTPGVVRMEPGLRGLLDRMGRGVRERLGGLERAPSEGARAVMADGEVRIGLDLAVSGSARAADVAARAQRAVAEAIASATGLTASVVTVSVLDVELSANGEPPA